MSASNSYLSLQANIVCLLLATIGSTIGSMAIVKHPAWFGDIHQTSGHVGENSVLAE
jgi:hypothetical protein